MSIRVTEVVTRPSCHSAMTVEFTGASCRAIYKFTDFWKAATGLEFSMEQRNENVMLVTVYAKPEELEALGFNVQQQKSPAELARSYLQNLYEAATKCRPHWYWHGLSVDTMSYDELRKLAVVFAHKYVPIGEL